MLVFDTEMDRVPELETEDVRLTVVDEVVVREVDTEREGVVEADGDLLDEAECVVVSERGRVV